MIILVCYRFTLGCETAIAEFNKTNLAMVTLVKCYLLAGKGLKATIDAQAQQGQPLRRTMRASSSYNIITAQESGLTQI